MGKLRYAGTALLLCILAAGEAFPFCFEEAGEMYKINPQILRAIAKVESNFDYTALHKNTNGTYDVGLMQINSGWASTLGKERWKNLGDACYNAKTGAWILSQCMTKYGYNWKAIGCYHSQSPEKRDQYAKMVFEQLQRVAPVAQEAAYDPLKKKLTTLVQQQVDSWVADSIKNGTLEPRALNTLEAQEEQPQEPQDMPVTQPQDLQQEQPQEQPPQDQQVQPQEPPPDQVQPQEQPPEQPQAPPEEPPQEQMPQAPSENQGEAP